MGFDADNQAATIAGLMGLILGSKDLPRDLLFPFPELGWTLPLNDFYKNVTRYDMPDAGLKDMASRMAAQGEKIILAHGGRKVKKDGREAYWIDPGAEFVAPLEFPSGPQPLIEAGAALDFTFPVFGGKAPYRWRLESSELPQGLRFADGKLSGTAQQTGVYPIRVQLSDASGQNLAKRVKLVVRSKNLAPAASAILASQRETNTARRDKLWLTVPKSLYAPSVEVIRDGKTLGDSSTFYSIGEETGSKEDFYGYEWSEPQTIGLLGYYVGSVEESAGWFASLSVEYRDAGGKWQPVQGLLISPPLAPGNEPFNKPHFVEYLLSFRPVETTAIRMIGQAGSAQHWHDATIYFTSISELTVHGALPRYEFLNR